MAMNFQRVFLVVIAVFFLTGISNKGIAKQQLFEAFKKVIAIDPGHGGDESGAQGPDGATEKAVTLTLAKKLAIELERKYKVVLTRTDDYPVELSKRTALANHHKAELFISIHTGGSFVHSSTGTQIYYFQNFTDNPDKSAGEATIEQEKKDSPILWDLAQRRHLSKSRFLARLINSRLNNSGVVPESRVAGAPLLLLQGANMPAILVEIEYLTNPAGEKKLNDQRFLNDLVQEISRGIDEYFEQNW